MATADELLAGVSIVDKTLIISNDLRKIAIPSSVTNLGVESDDDVLRLKFKLPRYIGDVDLSVFSIRINYLNAEGEGDIYTVNDAVVGAQYITFSWLVGPNATRYKGETKFNVCLRTLTSDGYVDREYNTTIATLPVLEGLEVDEGFVEQYSDLLEQWRSELFGIGDTEEAKIKAASEVEQEAIANKGAEVLATIPVDYTTAVSMTDNADRTKADAIVCKIQDKVIRVSDSSDDYFRGLRVFGKTTQVSTTGKNLYNLYNHEDKFFTPSVDTSEYMTILLDNTSGESKAYKNAYCNPQTLLTPATQYTIVVEVSSISNLTLYVNDDGTSSPSQFKGTWAITTAGTHVKTLTTKDSFDDIVSCLRTFVAVVQGVSGSVTFRLSILEDLSVISDTFTYESYSGGFTSPSPDWPQELATIETSSINVYGGNLLPANYVEGDSKTMNGITFVRQDDGTVLIDGTSTDIAYYSFNYSGNKIPLPNGWLSTSSGLGYGSDIPQIQNDIYVDGEYVFSLQTVNEGSSAKYIPDGAITLGATRIKIPAGITVDNVIVRPILCAFETPIVYEQPKEVQTLGCTTPTSLPAVPISEGGNYTDADGQQWICDEIDFERGVYIQRIGTKVYDGSVDESWFTASKQYYISIPDKRNNHVQVPNALRCSHFKVHPTVKLDLGYISETNYHNGNVNILVNFDDGVGGVDNFVTWLQSNPITVYYVLATPIETSLSAEEIEAFQFAHTNFPNTTILNDAGAMMELKYNADTKTYLDNCFRPTDAQVQAAVDAWLTAHYSSAEGVSF